MFAISLYAYGTSYLVVPLFLLLVIPFAIYKKKITTFPLTISATVFTILALPILLFIIINHFDYSPIKIVGMTMPRLTENRTTLIFNLAENNFLTQIIRNTLRFCYTCILQSDNPKHNVIAGFGTLYYVSLPFLLLGIGKILKDKKQRTQSTNFLMLIWLACSVILGLCTHTSINRLNIIFIPMIYFVAEGIFVGYSILKEKYKNPYINGIAAIYGFYFLMFIGYYFTMYNEKIANNFCAGFDKSLQFCNENFPNDTINICKKNINMPYIYICFYNRIPPDIFRKTVVYDEKNMYFRTVESFDKYRFVTPDKLIDSPLAIFSKDDFETFQNLIKNKKSQKFDEYYVVYE
jgi:hypothetical protein